MLIDHILDKTAGLTAPYSGTPQYVVEALKYVVKHDQIYNIQQVYDHIKPLRHEHPTDVGDYPATIPPGDAVWFEFNASGYDLAGLLIVDYDLFDDRDKELFDKQNDEDKEFFGDMSPAARWFMSIRTIAPTKGNGMRGLNYLTYAVADCEGYLRTFHTDVDEGSNENDESEAATIVVSDTVLTALCFMNARGTLIDRNCQQPRPERRRREKAGLKPAIRFNTVNIKPILQRYARPQDAPQSHRAYHWVRGNFARYTADAPLFGKYVGTVYRPLHAAGSKAEGRVIKTYRVEAPT